MEWNTLLTFQIFLLLFSYKHYQIISVLFFCDSEDCILKLNLLGDEYGW